jgi:uncharacterized membrane protein
MAFCGIFIGALIGYCVSLPLDGFVRIGLGGALGWGLVALLRYATATDGPDGEPRQNFLVHWVGRAKDWLLGGNTIVRTGLLILFTGLAFLARNALVNDLVPPELLLATCGTAAIALLLVGFHRRHAKPAFAVAMQGTGVAAMYLAAFAAFRLYALLPLAQVFVFMVFVCASSCVLAIRQNAPTLALAAFSGGFAVPVLLSTGEGSHVVLFVYYTVLNLAIVTITHRRAWPLLGGLGFVATFGVATVWGSLRYSPAYLASTEPFLVGFLLLFMLALVSNARHVQGRVARLVGALLLFGTPLVGFALQYELVKTVEFGAAFSALGFAAVYLAAATALRWNDPVRHAGLAGSFIALGIGFLTLALPFGLDAGLVPAVWAVEGVVAFWIGMRQVNWLARVFGLGMQAVAVLMYLNAGSLSEPGAMTRPFANAMFLDAALLGLCAMVMAGWLRRRLVHAETRPAQAYETFEAALRNMLFFYGFAWWCGALLVEIAGLRPWPDAEPGAFLIFSEASRQMLSLLALLVSAWVSMQFGVRAHWKVATLPGRLSALVIAAVLLRYHSFGYNVLQTPLWLIWPIALLLHFHLLRQQDRIVLRDADTDAQTPYGATHVNGVWIVTAIFADGLRYGIDKGGLWSTDWAGVTMLASATAAVAGLTAWAGRANRAGSAAGFGWPLGSHARSYYWNAALPLVALVFVGAAVAALHSSGNTAPLPYLPLINPTDLSLALALGTLVFWRRMVRAAEPMSPASQLLCGRGADIALVALAFLACNSVWLRVAHHYLGVDWNPGALFSSYAVQSGYAILWALLSLGAMVFAHRRGRRGPWMAGAVLLAAVVAKLGLVDFANSGGSERIFAFIGVGLLMLVVGYLAPVPPKVAT